MSFTERRKAEVVCAGLLDALEMALQRKVPVAEFVRMVSETPIEAEVLEAGVTAWKAFVATGAMPRVLAPEDD